MTTVYNNVAQGLATSLYGRRATFLRNGSMPATNTLLRQLRTRAKMSVREVAEALGFPGHSRYSYYESGRFKGFLPVDLARVLADIYASRGVPKDEVMKAAGLHLSESDRDYARIVGEEFDLPFEVAMMVRLPSEVKLERMFSGLLKAIDVEDPAGEHARTLASLFPAAFAKIPLDLPLRDRTGAAEILGRSVFSREADLPNETKARQRKRQE